MSRVDFSEAAKINDICTKCIVRSSQLDQGHLGSTIGMGIANLDANNQKYQLHTKIMMHLIKHMLKGRKARGMNIALHLLSV